MKNVLIVISNMGLGGAQRSLLSFLECLSASEQKEEYRVSLMVVNSKGEFYRHIPSEITQLKPPISLHWLGTALSAQLIRKHFSARCLLKKLRWIAGKKLGIFPKQLNVQQKLWECWKDEIPKLPGHYDVAVSYIDGFPNYYVIEKVRADKKVLWIHNEYQKLQYNAEYDAPYYEKADEIITISPKCRQCILEAFPAMENKVHILENITVSDEVQRKSQMGQASEYEDFHGLKLLCVGRLRPQKAYDLAIEAANILKLKQIPFRWLILGDGPEYQRLQQQIDHFHLNDSFFLLGNRENPYAYMAKCDILVQTSRFEGKSVVLDEAKILEKPIVATNYTTVVDSITHGRNGWIVEMTPEAIAEGIITLWESDAIRQTLIQTLVSEKKDNTQQVRNYIRIML